jgi:hypothetical protein
MKRPFLSLAIGASLVASPAQAADDPLQFGLALRSGYALNTEDHLMGYQLGLGLTLEHPLAQGLLLQGELAYFSRSGRQYLAGIQAPALGQPPADPTLSADLRKNALQGLVVRLGAEWALDPEWSVMGGLQMGDSRFSQEIIGQVQDTAQTYLDTYNSTPVKSVFAVSPYVGVQYSLDASNLVELDLLGLSYTAIDFSHSPGAPLVAGSTSQAGSSLVYQGDHLDSKSRFAPTVEIAYRFRF